MTSGREWVVEAFGCRPESLRDLARIQALFAALVTDLHLNPIQPAQWNQFPGPAGITGLVLLAESHLACHTFPEHGALTLNLFCCRPRPEWDFTGYLTREFGACEVRIRRLERPFSSDASAEKAIA
jgi:S-adenosylmethionine decarboxylase